MRPLKPAELRLTLHKGALSPDHVSQHPKAIVHIARVLLTSGRLVKACTNEHLDPSQYYIFPYLRWIVDAAPLCRRCRRALDQGAE
jgi:hypothetical protein